MKDFELYIPTKVIFGKKALKQISKELPKLGKKALWIYGRSSIKKTGLYERLRELLSKANIEYIELGGIKSNPLLSKVLEGIEIAKENKIDFILAVGGGSVIDTGKAIACGYYYKGDIWDFFERRTYPEKALPIAVVLTISGAGSELNEVSVIVHDTKKVKRSLRSFLLFPKVSFLDPTLTFTVSPEYTAYGAVDAFSHVFEVFINREYKKESLVEDFMIILMRNIIKWSKIAFKEPTNYQARANLMWASSLALCGLTKVGIGSYRFPIHAIEHTLSGGYDIPHGLGLAILMFAWIKKNKENKLIKKFFEKVFDLSIKNKTMINKGIEIFEGWLKELKIPTTLREINIPKEDLGLLAEKAFEIFKLYKAEKEYPKEKIQEILEIAYL
ncbi:MAG: Alcohol dehydrogenase YqhD [Thermodesulfobacteria bacterium]|nr:iron-containing alcohol dehydrogenase [Thermodesulfobacteriota bacterium]MCU4139001.1 Alcohol dehydrogenase YqhD [Thermodesulfobacteriota bacterium]